MKIEVNAEICCDLCGEITHNHIDCPKCNSKNVGTDAYYEISREDHYNEMACEKCGARYRLIAGYWFDGEWLEIV
jgi:hypothetical protein